MSGEFPNQNNEQSPDAETRGEAIAAIGHQLDTFFDRHADFATEDTDGTKRVILRVQLSTTTVPAHVESRTDDQGVRTAYMWLQHNGKALGSELFKYTDGPNVVANFEPYSFNENGQKVPRPPDSYSSSDHGIISLGNTWKRNLENLPAIDPNSREALGKKSSRLRQLLGKLASR